MPPPGARSSRSRSRRPSPRRPTPRFGRELASALRRATDAVAGRVHLSLVLTGGNVDGLGAATLFDLPFASYAFDLIAGPENWRLIAEAPGDRGIVCGALDPADTADDRPEPLVWAAHYAASTRGRGLERVGLANASSLASLPRDRAIRKLAALAEAARLASIADPHELAASIDPRAVDARSAALGRYRRRTNDSQPIREPTQHFRQRAQVRATCRALV